jgi:hypothetical protein
VASDGNTLNVATEIWRTGAFPAIPSDATGPRKVRQAATTYDMYGAQAGAAAGIPQHQLSYRHRQQAGIDALLAIATPVARSSDQDGDPAEARDPITNRDK